MKKAAAMRALYFMGYVLLILPHINPAYFDLIPFLNALFNVARLASFYFIVIRLFIIRHRISGVTLLILCIETYILFVTMLRQGEVYLHLVNMFSLLSVVFLYETVEDKPEIFLSALLFCFETAVYINFLTVLLYPDGMYDSRATQLFISHRNYFLGYYNNLDKYFIPALVTAWLYAEVTGKRLRTFIMMAIVCVSTLLLWSGGGILTVFVMIFAYISSNYVEIPLLKYKICWFIHPAFFVSIILLQMELNFKWLIDGVLHKWRSLISRIDLWNKMILLISDEPIFGHGILSALNRERESGFYFAMHAHNMLLEILYQGGLVYLLLFTALVISAGKEFLPYRNTRVAQILTIGFLGWCVHTTVEPYMTSFLMGMFVLTCKCGLFESVAESRRKRENEISQTSKRRVDGKRET